VARGKRVRFRLELDSQKLADVESANVVAELRGSERPEEIVLLGAHLDSWDLGQGAHDDGAGCTMIMQALTDLRTLGLRPRRTIRVVLFTNEENGLKGALAYAETHRDEHARVVAAFEADIGGFAPRGLQLEVNKEREVVALARVKDLLSLTAPLGADRVVPGKSGADLIPLVKAGVLGLGLVTDHASYFDVHHTEADTLDKVDPADLAKNAAFVATIAYAIADAPERLDAP
jgi:carboxypeptidase Q